MTGPLVLGIETSCDETGIGVVRGREVLANTIASSMEEQARYGGVVPEIAARAHLEALRPALEAALAEAGVRVPRDVAIAGFDDIPEGRFHTPSLTTVAPDLHALTTEVLDVLIARIEGTPVPPRRHQDVPWRLVVRESTAGTPTPTWSGRP